MVELFDEPSVGISLFFGDVLGQTGCLSLQCAVKHRFSDFIVNEVDQHGEVVWFQEETDLQKWKQKNILLTMPGQDYVEPEEEKEPQKQIDVCPLAMAALAAILTAEDLQAFQSFVADLQQGAKELDTPLVLGQSFEDKEQRASFHQLFKDQMPQYITDTIVQDDNRNAGGQARKMQIYLRDGLSNKQRKKLHLTDRTSKAHVPQYLSVAIYKENVESMHAVHYLARRIRKVPKQVSIAGNKDKRGITTQRATICRADAEQLIRQQRCKDWDPKIKVGSFQRVFHPL